MPFYFSELSFLETKILKSDFYGPLEGKVYLLIFHNFGTKWFSSFLDYSYIPLFSVLLFVYLMLEIFCGVNVTFHIVTSIHRIQNMYLKYLKIWKQYGSCQKIQDPQMRKELNW